MSAVKLSLPNQYTVHFNILLTGSRNWDDRDKMVRALHMVHSDLREKWKDGSHCKFTLIHGACRGADLMGAEIATSELKWDQIACPAQWNVVKNGQTVFDRAAGVKRNQEMLKKYKPSTVVAFLRENSKGTRDTIERAARDDNVRTIYVVHYDKDEIQVMKPLHSTLHPYFMGK